MNQKTVYIETYGCSANLNNSEILAGILSNSGFIITNNINLADIIIINSCVVKGKTESKIKRRVQDLKSNKKLMIITSCIAETDFKKLKKLNSQAIFLGTHNISKVNNLINDYYNKKLDDKKQKEYLKKSEEIKLNLPKIPKNKLISIHQISEGCLGNCSYCKTKLAKGDLFSYPSEEILKSIESDLKNGAKEIWITSQDNASYGLDQTKERKHQLPELLKAILSLKHKFKLRLGMMDPNNVLPILDELIEIYKDKKMYKFLHIPIQSASNSVLKHMNRFYTIEQVEKIITRFRMEIPNITIATDLIVGYPTETQVDHEANFDFMKKYELETINFSKFSSHKQTLAGKLKILSNSIIKKRIKQLVSLHKQISLAKKGKLLNKEINVFIDENMGETLYRARDESYNLYIIQLDKANKQDLGKEIKVKVIKAGTNSLIAEKI